MSEHKPTSSARSYELAHAEVAHQLPAGGWLDALRREALSRFTRQGFPTRRDEDWKYTSLRPLEQQRFVPSTGAAGEPDAQWLEGLKIENLDAIRLVFVDGFYVAGLSTADELPEGVTVQSLAAVLADEPERLKGQLGAVADQDMHRFAALNTAFVADGAWLHVPADVEVQKPVHLLFVTTADDTPRLVQPRVLVSAERHSRVTLIEHYADPEASTAFSNSVTEISTGEGARVEHYLLQEHGSARYHVGSVHVAQQADSEYVSHNINLGGALVRQDIHPRMLGEGANVVLNGLFLVGDGQHVDNHTRVDHAVPHTGSDEYYKGVLWGKGRAVFNGKVIIHRDAQKTDASQYNGNLLLSPMAEIDTKPELEIYADDVKAAHGATVGQLDEDAMFYLRSRGLDARTAREVLTFAFAGDVVSRMGLAPLRERLEAAIARRLPGGGLA